MPLISIVIPVYNEQDCLPSIFERLDSLQDSRSELILEISARTLIYTQLASCLLGFPALATVVFGRP